MLLAITVGEKLLVLCGYLIGVAEARVLGVATHASAADLVQVLSGPALLSFAQPCPPVPTLPHPTTPYHTIPQAKTVVIDPARPYPTLPDPT